MDEKDDWTDDEELDQELLNFRHIKVQDVPFDPVAFAAQSLRKQFIEAQKLFLQSADGNEKSAAKSALERFKVVQKGISQAAVFSTNESIEEIATGDLKYLLVQSYLSKLYLSASESTSDARMQAIKESLNAAFEFLKLCESLEILAPHDRLLWKQLKKDLKNLDSENPSINNGNESLNAMQMREIKIAQFRQRKDNQERLTAIQAKMEKLRNDTSKDPDEIDDEMERDYFIITIHEAVRESLSDVSLSLSELDLLKQRQQLLEKNPMADQNIPLSNKTPKVLKVDQLGRVTEVPIKSNSIDSRVHDRCNLRETVFRNANPSTMTIEEMARIEMQNMQASAPEKTPYELEEEEIQKDKDKFVDRETLKAREWDNWKDDNEKGIGNRMIR